MSWGDCEDGRSLTSFGSIASTIDLEPERTIIGTAVVPGRMRTFELRADDTGTIELVCERTDEDAPAPHVRSFAGRDEFGLLVDDLTPGERVRLFVDDADPEE